jgi:DNA polymerase III epsilon subunit family exonuclease
MQMRVRHLIAFDTATTGFSASRDQIIELAAVKFVPGVGELDTFETLVNPGKSVPPEITELTGLTDMDLFGAPQPLEAVQRFLDWAGEETLFLAHNAIFDVRYLNRAFLDQGMFVPSIPVVDTLPWVRNLRLPVPDHKLQTLLAHVGHDPGSAHRSLADARGLSTLVSVLLQGEPDPIGVLLPWLVSARKPRPETSFDVVQR